VKNLFSKLRSVFVSVHWIGKPDAGREFVRGRLRRWQFVVLALLLNVPVLFLTQQAVPVFVKATVDRLCESGPLGITIGWWYFALTLSCFVMFFFASSVYSFVLAHRILRQRRFPLTHQIPWLDTELKEGGKAIRHAWRLRVGSVLILGMTVWIAYMSCDLVSVYGLNLGAKDEAHCKSAITKRNPTVKAELLK
jgi:hypothetical protein